MGAFFLYHNSSQIDESRIDEFYTKKGFNEPLSVKLGDYYLKLFKKQLVQIKNYYVNNVNYVFSCGSLFYKGLNYLQSLNRLLIDYSEGKIDPNELFGNYILIFYSALTRKLEIFIDPSFIKNIYYDREKKIITTDFLVLLLNREGRYTYNKYAIVENLTTGNLISPDTYVDEIQKIDKINSLELHKYFPGLIIKRFVPEILAKISNRRGAINNANSLLSDYFKASGEITNEFGAHIGLTGGFDSRLLLMHARKHIRNLSTNSFWRPNSVEYKNAKELAKVAGLDFYSNEGLHFGISKEKDFKDELMFVFDGQIRSQNRWDQEFALREYTAKLANGHYVGYHGCGGEQYRNSERWSGKRSLNSFIYYDWMFRQGKNPFKNAKFKEEIFQYIHSKITRIEKELPPQIGLMEVKKIYNEILNSSNRATRVNILNQQQFYFAPFTEYLISQNAYKYVPFLGHSLAFQIDMMRVLDPQLSALNTNYGYNLMDGEPFSNKVMACLAGLLPRKIIIGLHYEIKGKNSSHTERQPFSNFLHPLLLDFQKYIDFSSITNNDNLSPGLIAFDHLLKKVNTI